MEDVIIEAIKHGVRENMREWHRVDPVFFFIEPIAVRSAIKNLVHVPGFFAMLPASLDAWGSQDGKASFASGVRALARRCRPAAVAFVSEAWTHYVAQFDSAEGRRALALASEHRLEEMPGRQEVVVVEVESYAGGPRTWTAPISGEGESRTVGAFEELKMPPGAIREGTLTGFLP